MLNQAEELKRKEEQLNKEVILLRKQARLYWTKHIIALDKLENEMSIMADSLEKYLESKDGINNLRG